MSLLTLIGMDVNGQERVALPGDQVRIPFVIAQGDTPTLTLTAALGTGATAAIVGNPFAGKITMNSGVLGLAIGKILTLTLPTGLAAPNGLIVTFSAGNAAFAGIAGSLYAVTTTNTIDLYTGAVALGVSAMYVGYYKIAGY